MLRRPRPSSARPRPYQIQGVRQLGRAVAIMHYRVHFHMARRTLQVTDGRTNRSPSSRTVGRRSMTAGSPSTPPRSHAGAQTSATVDRTRLLPRGTAPRPRTGSSQTSACSRARRSTTTIQSAPRSRHPHGDGAGGPGRSNARLRRLPYYSDSTTRRVLDRERLERLRIMNWQPAQARAGACYWLVPGAISGPSRPEMFRLREGEQRGRRARHDPLRVRRHPCSVGDDRVHGQHDRDLQMASINATSEVSV